MKLEKIVSWLDKTLNVAAFDDVSNNGLQVGREDKRRETRDARDRTRDARREKGIGCVAFAVDASVRAVAAAVAAGAELLVVHHGISWGGGIKRLEGGVYNVVKAAMDANLAIYACHLPLDAHPTLGNNAQLAKWFGLKNVCPAFTYHGNVIGLVGTRGNEKIGVCSGGAGEFAEEAKRLGCDRYITGEASWGDVIAAENCGMRMECLGHYETEVWGVRAVSAAMKKALKVKTVDLTEQLRRTES